MDLDKLLRAGMSRCGRILNVLPETELKCSPVEYMMGVLEDDTLPDLDILIPRLLSKTFPIYALQRVADGDMNSGAPTMDARYCAFRIPPVLTDGAPPIGIKKIIQAYQPRNDDLSALYSDTTAYGYNKWGRPSSAMLYARSYGTMLRYADGMLAGTTTPQIRAKFFSPNILWINRPYAEQDTLSITVTFKIGNDKHLISVSDASFSMVRELFILDLKASLYNAFGMFSEVDTSSGVSLNLRLDDWSGAEAERVEKFKEYQSTCHFRNESMYSG